MLAIKILGNNIFYTVCEFEKATKKSSHSLPFFSCSTQNSVATKVFLFWIHKKYVCKQGLLSSQSHQSVKLANLQLSYNNKARVKAISYKDLKALESIFFAIFLFFFGGPQSVQN